MFSSSFIAIFIIGVIDALKQGSANGVSIARKRSRGKNKKTDSTPSKMVPKARIVEESDDNVLSPEDGLNGGVIISDDEPFGRLLSRNHKEDSNFVNGECLTGENDNEDLEPLISDPSQRSGTDVLRDDTAKDIETSTVIVQTTLGNSILHLS